MDLDQPLNNPSVWILRRTQQTNISSLVSAHAGRQLVEQYPASIVPE